MLSPTLRIDLDKHLVILDAEVVLREGPLELLICPRRTKEHESVLAAEVAPKTFQLALLMAGAEPGSPASFNPYKPPTGQRLKIWLEYEKDGSQQRIDAREWIRDINTDKPMAADFVFAGSRFHKVPGVERPIFLGDEGDLVCVSNFPGSVVDVGAKSSRENPERLFEAMTKSIPPKATKVRVVFEPIVEPAK